MFMFSNGLHRKDAVFIIVLLKCDTGVPNLVFQIVQKLKVEQIL